MVRSVDRQCTVQMVVAGVRIPVTFTARQAEVLRLAVRGLTAKQIARRLQISRRTVEHHLDEARRRTGAKTRAALIVQAVEAGLVP